MDKRYRNTHRVSLKTNMIGMLLMVWFIPLILITLVMVYYLTIKSEEQISNTITTSVEKAYEMLDTQMVECEKLSKYASYYTDIRDAYTDYKTSGRESTLATKINRFLTTQYKYDSNCKTAIVIFNDIPDKSYFTYNNSTHATYKNIESFNNSAKDTVINMSKELDTDIAVVSIDGHTYMIRNLVMPDFKPYAVIVIELNEESLMKGFSGVWGASGAAVILDGAYILGESGLYDETADIFGRGKAIDNGTFYKRDHGRYSYAMVKNTKYGSSMEAVVRIDNSVIYAKNNSAWYMYMMIVIFAIPLMYVIWWFFNKKITRPISRMMDAYEAIGKEEYGTKIEDMADSREFYYMQQSFNNMSDQLRNQFEKIYVEEIALRDAKIMTLQSQINPHFLNNTLEIINWEARLNKNYKVSSMIEALSTMLEATMNRKEEGFHSVSEELAYVDAYIYIISQRLGDRFEFGKDIDDGLLNIQMPRLIVQPIVENAVEHGMTAGRNCRIDLRLYKQEGYVRIEVENNKCLMPEDKDRINKLLNESAEPGRERSVNLGIRNVNMRLKLIYGDDCGLKIENNAEGNTVSTIIFRENTDEQ